METHSDQIGSEQAKSWISDSDGDGIPEAKHLLLYRVVLPYLSPLLVHEVLSTSSVPSVRHAFYQGSVLFVDIAGFSQISETLSKQGKVGAEEMTDILNRYFAELLNIALLYGGQQIKFGGDALLLYFGGRNHAERAAGCALRMQRAMQNFTVVRTSRGDYPLSLHIGANSGSFYAASVGRPGRRHEYLFSGPGVTRAIAAQGLAGPGEVFVGPLMAALLASRARLAPPQHGYSLLKSLRRTRLGVGANRFEPPGDAPRPEQVAMLSSYLPPPLVERITARPDGLELMGEHRLVTVVFVNFYDLDTLLFQDRPSSAEDLLQELQRYFVMVERTVSYYGGIVARCDPVWRSGQP